MAPMSGKQISLELDFGRTPQFGPQSGFMGV